MEKCESCRRNAVEVIDTELDSVIPYRLCNACYSRLVNLSLRPREYFNLVAIHGHEYELHDDLYDDDGSACCPEVPVEVDETLEFPTISDLQEDLGGLLDYATVKWWFPRQLTECLSRFPTENLLEELDRRLKVNPFLLSRYLEIVSHVLKEKARDWVVYQYKKYEGDEELMFTEAFASCLPVEEGFALVTSLFSKMEDTKLHQHVWALHYFHSKRTLEWVEQNSHRFTNITTSFGEVCAASHIDWETAERWLKSGRPLSLIALDALLACGTTEDKAYMPLYLREQPPKLLYPEDIDQMNQVLDQYLESDKVHRPKVTIAAIKGEWKDILKL